MEWGFGELQRRRCRAVRVLLTSQEQKLIIQLLSDIQYSKLTDRDAKGAPVHSADVVLLPKEVLISRWPGTGTEGF